MTNLEDQIKEYNRLMQERLQTEAELLRIEGKIQLLKEQEKDKEKK